jgi:O-antigen ligase
VVVAFAVGMLLWVAARGLSAFALTGQWSVDAFQAALVVGGLACAAAAAHPTLTGWTLLALGSVYVYGNLWALRRNFGSVDTAFPGAGQWGSSRLADGSVPPDCSEVLAGTASVLEETLLFLRAPQGACTMDGVRVWMPLGIDGNPNGTSNMVALAVVFAAPFVVHRWGTWIDHRLLLVVLGRVGLFALLVVPGIALLYLLEGRSALIGTLSALLVLLVPLRWARGSAWSWAFASAVVVTIMIPFASTKLSGASFAGRSCVWVDWWDAVGPTPLWGIGPPGTYPAEACGGTLTQWAHAHNEFLQAWAVSGILGLILAVMVIGGLSWYAMRYRDLDDRILMSLMTCAAVLLGFEILVNVPAGWIRPNLVFFVTVAAFSLGLMSRSRGGVGSESPHSSTALAPVAGSKSHP